VRSGGGVPQQQPTMGQSNAMRAGVLAPMATTRVRATRTTSPPRTAASLKPDKQAAHLVRLAKVCKGVAQRLVAQPQQR
jgi:hypothetical protein